MCRENCSCEEETRESSLLWFKSVKRKENDWSWPSTSALASSFYVIDVVDLLCFAYRLLLCWIYWYCDRVLLTWPTSAEIHGCWQASLYHNFWFTITHICVENSKIFSILVKQMYMYYICYLRGFRLASVHVKLSPSLGVKTVFPVSAFSYSDLVARDAALAAGNEYSRHCPTHSHYQLVLLCQESGSLGVTINAVGGPLASILNYQGVPLTCIEQHPLPLSLSYRNHG